MVLVFMFNKPSMLFDGGQSTSLVFLSVVEIFLRQINRRFWVLNVIAPVAGKIRSTRNAFVETRQWDNMTQKDQKNDVVVVLDAIVVLGRCLSCPVCLLLGII